jgi:hypothetical protein
MVFRPIYVTLEINYLFLGLHMHHGLALSFLRVRVLYGRDYLQIRHPQRRPKV